MVLSGLSIFGDAKYRDAARPLFEQGAVEAIEWSVDAWQEPPDETAAHLKKFGAAGKLIGHGIHYPVLADSKKLQGEWLAHLAKDVAAKNYCGLSVHFGFATGWELVEGAPLPVPYCAEALKTGRRALAELAKVAGCNPADVALIERL